MTTKEPINSMDKPLKLAWPHLRRSAIRDAVLLYVPCGALEGQTFDQMCGAMNASEACLLANILRLDILMKRGHTEEAERTAMYNFNYANFHVSVIVSDY